MMVSSPWVRRDTGGVGYWIERRRQGLQWPRGKQLVGGLDAVGLLSKCMHAWFEIWLPCVLRVFFHSLVLLL